VRALLGIDHSIACCEHLWNEDDYLDFWKLRDCDFEMKIAAAKEITQQYGVALEHCGFVGNGSNDVPLAKVVGVSIAFNAHKKLQQVCTHVINQETYVNFNAVTEIFSQYF
jgi:phosphoserine phosphatase